jgi:putative mRNA 3-end processing factor
MPFDDPATSLLCMKSEGLYCPLGDFYIDPQKPVKRALITHGHSDHARPYMKSYLTSETGRAIVQERVGKDAKVEGIGYGQSIAINDVTVSFHPAGHLLGSSQIRIEHKGFVSCVAGDYKIEPDASCETFEVVPCHQFITESTFALPIYTWESPKSVFSEINTWWRENQSKGVTSVLFAYALGKAQRILCGIDPSIGPIGVHGSVDIFNRHYLKQGYPIPETIRANRETKETFQGQGIIIAPGSTQNTPWLKQFTPQSLAFASGWMAVRGTKRRRALDRGFVLSDHVDWKGIIKTIDTTGAEHVGATHGYSDALVRWLSEHKGLDAYTI